MTTGRQRRDEMLKMADDLTRVHYLLNVRNVKNKFREQQYLEVRRIAGRAEELLRELARGGSE